MQKLKIKLKEILLSSITSDCKLFLNKKVDLKMFMVPLIYRRHDLKMQEFYKYLINSNSSYNKWEQGELNNCNAIVQQLNTQFFFFFFF